MGTAASEIDPQPLIEVAPSEHHHRAIEPWPTESEILDQLIAAHVIDSDRVVDDGITVESSSRRNRNLRITWPDGTGYLAKLPDGRSPLSRRTLRAEVHFYRLSRDMGTLEGLLVPMLYDDPERGMLVLDLQSRHRTMQELLIDRAPGEFPISVQRRAASALGRLHAAELGVVDDVPQATGVAPIADYGRPDPWILATATQSTMLVLEMLNDLPEVTAGLTNLVRNWQPETLVHGDVRPDNFLIKGRSDLRIVDWELWHIGDPAQDLGSLLAAAVPATLGEAAMATPYEQTVSETPSMNLEEASTILQAVSAAVWEEYLATRELTSGAARRLAARATSYAAARLVQAVMEMADRNDAVTPGGVALLEIANKLFTDPERAAIEFFSLGGHN